MILVGLLVVLSGLFMSVSIHHLNQSYANYFDFVALTMVLGGTLTVALVLIPWDYRKDLWRALGFLFRPEKRLHQKAVIQSIEMIQVGRYRQKDGKWLYQKILSDGSELIELGFTNARIQSILTERIYHTVKRWRKIASSVRSLAKYPPAFGLIGTVLGLVNVMRGLGAAAGAANLGVEMSVALVSTMYGLLVANFVVNPIGELLLKKAEEEEEYAEIALNAVLLLNEKATLVEAHESLNAMVADDQRMKFEDLMKYSEAS